MTAFVLLRTWGPLQSKDERLVMNKKVLLIALFALSVSSFASAQSDAKPGTVDFNDFKPTKIMTPIWSEILVIPFPAGFVGASARTHNDFYINEMILKGETIDHWTQMVTQTGRQGLSLRPNVTPEGYLSAIAGGIKGHCPDTFFAKAIGATKVSGHDGFVAWATCGSLTTDGYAHSESTLFLCIKGTEDYYTVQWSERGVASSQPLVYDDAKWGERLKELNSVTTLPRVPAQPSPNPAGADQN
jgi:hypothetical protein